MDNRDIGKVGGGLAGAIFMRLHRSKIYSWHGMNLRGEKKRNWKSSGLR